MKDAVSPSTPHFRKIVLSRTISHNKLRIPKEFMKKYGSNISNPVLVKVPGGKGEWKMRVTDLDENGDSWLTKGWPEFAKHYELEDGQSLIFKYKGHSRFKVVIIGKYGLEIDYPKMPSDTKEFNESDVEISREEEEDDNDEEHDEEYNEEEDEEEEKGNYFSCPRKSIKRNPRGPFSSPQNIDCEAIGMNYGSMSSHEKAKALSRTKDYLSLNPFFKVVIQQTHLQDCCDLVISPEFWVEHLNDKSGHFVTLYIPTGEKWPVIINTTNIGTNEVRASFMKGGWKKFAEDNDLEIGDVCIFELMGSKEVLLKVSIFRNSQESLEESFVNNSSSKEGIKTKYSSKTHSSFNVQLRDSFLFKLHVPRSFANIHFDSKTSENLKLQVGRKFWKVRLIKTASGSFFSAGWRAFVKDNRLRIGDSCVFERVYSNHQDELIILKVTLSSSFV